MDILVVVLRLVHIVGGCLWVGFAVFVAFYLAPAVQDAGEKAHRCDHVGIAEAVCGTRTSTRTSQ